MFLVAVVVAHFCSESTTKSGSLPVYDCYWFFLELASTYTNLSIVWSCGPEWLNPTKIALVPSVGLNNSLVDLVDCSIGFAFCRFLSKKGESIAPEKVLQILNLRKNLSLTLCSQRLQKLSKRSQNSSNGYKSGKLVKCAFPDPAVVVVSVNDSLLTPSWMWIGTLDVGRVRR